MIAAVQLAIPESASLPLNVTASGWLYQPFASGGRAGVAVAFGGVASYLIASAAVLELPAWSTHEPDTDAAPLSGPENDVAALHEPMPDVASVPENDTPTGWLYQPFESAARAAAALTDGGVASYLSGNEAGALTLPALSVQVPETLAEPPSGPEYAGAAHDASPELLSVPAKVTVTGCVYQPFASGGRSAVSPVTVGASTSMLNCRWNAVS